VNGRPDIRRWWRLPAVRIALIYAAVSVAWILGSDHLAVLVAGDSQAVLTRIQQSKGLFFVLSSSVLIYLLVQMHYRRLVGAQRLLAERERELQHAQKMEAVGLLAGGIAHDFNNLLQVINGRAELVRDEPCLDAASRASVEEIGAAGRRAARLVSQLLAFSRRQVLQPETLDLDEVVATVLGLLERTLGGHIRIEFRRGERLGAVRADRGQLEQVLMNLCINARDAMPDGGVLTVETGTVNFDAVYCRAHLWARPGNYVLLSVADTGVGMDEATQARIWEPFFTTKDPGKGTGLGLPTVYGIVRQHEGLVHLYSERGRGTVFRIYLPLVAGQAAPAGAREREPARGGRERILVAEDNEAVRSLVERLLRQAGYTVVLANDGEQALQMLADSDGEVDLVLLDVVMPGLGGRQVYDRARERWPHLRFLFTSGYSFNGMHTDFVLDQGFQMIQKPFESRLLLAAVRRALETG
jgi:two-component system, cell cycle sensor histidine kinase and response regulator CckA